MTGLVHLMPAFDIDSIGRLAAECLKREIATYPKPGLVSPIDSGAHDDMDAAMMQRSADVLEPYFAAMADAGAAGAGIDRLRAIGVAAELAMMQATGGINTHRGAIFGMGLLCAGAGFRERHKTADTLGAIVTRRWAVEIQRSPPPPASHGGTVARQHGAGGARVEAASGFPSVYAVALPALVEGRRLAPADPQAAQVHALMMLLARVVDTNLLYRGGVEGLNYARQQARTFLREGGCGAPGWRGRAIAMHRAFVARRLSPGGCADLLAMALFVETVET